MTCPECGQTKPGPDQLFPDQPAATPLVRAAAAKHGVDLRYVAATGAGGRIRVDDVRTHVRFMQAAAVNSVLASSPTAGAVADTNPLVEQLALTEPGRHREAMRRQPPPTLFEGGDLPPFTASGIDPSVLASAPWAARHAIAAASRPEALKILAEVAGAGAGSAGELVAEACYGDHPGNLAYERRVREWAAGGSR